ncbi:antibiotic biosynthesis monooxygenase [Haloferax namakaokahaiae]|uniref:Antibiotic biosynthesis monooxygenase n=1 Tax=Haloferax namakaokahaiae TaxID=1748331 RepID=A0ABD5ZDQ1_9EURY
MVYLHVNATVKDYDEWKADFERYHSLRADFGGKGYQLYRTTEKSNEIVVVIEFESEQRAREWTNYLKSQGELLEPKMEADVSYLELVEQKQVSAV